MAEPDRKNGFAGNVSKTEGEIDTEQKTSGRGITFTTNEKYFLKIVIAAIIAVLFILFAFSLSVGKFNTLPNFISDMLNKIGGLLLSGDIVVAIIERKNKEREKIYRLIIVGIFAVLCWGLSWVINTGSEEKEATVLVQIDSIPVEEYLPGVTVKSVEVFEKKQYERDADPFVESLEQYLGVEKGSIAPNDAVNMMKKVLVDDINAEKAKAEMETAEKETTDKERVPQIYQDSTKLAEAQHETYDKQRTRDWDSEESFAVILQEHRLDDLQSAIDYRIQANSVYEDSENMRLIAVYCKEKGDEYRKRALFYNSDDEAFSREEAEAMAQQYYEEGAQWCMKAIYCTIVKEDSKNTSKIMGSFETIMNEANSEKISSSFSAYELVVAELAM